MTEMTTIMTFIDTMGSSEREFLQEFKCF